jgi:hypothetical protein
MNYFYIIIHLFVFITYNITSYIDVESNVGQGIKFILYIPN